LKITLIRHGETELNRLRVIQGTIPGVLTEQGKLQAELLRQRLSRERFQRAYSSDLKRTAETTAIVTRPHRISISFTPLLRERCFGVFQGRPFSEYDEWSEAQTVPLWEIQPSGGESFIDVEERAAAFLDMVSEEHKGEHILVSAHGLFNQVLIKVALGLSWHEALSLKQSNTCVNVLSLDDSGKMGALAVNCVSHLQAEIVTSNLES